MSTQADIVVTDHAYVAKSRSMRNLISRLFGHGKAIVTTSISFGIVLVVWQLVGASDGPRSIFLPTPGTVMRALWQLFTETSFYVDVWWSIYRVSVGFLLSILVAVPLGLLAGRFKIIDRLVQPINDFTRYLPVASLIPLCILWVGIGDLNKILIIFIGTVFQLIPLVADTALNVPESLIDIARACGASKSDVVWKVVFRWCLPTIYDQSRVALGWAWSYLIVAELVATTSGIGRVIIQAQRFIQTPRVIAGIIVIGCLGLFFDQTFKKMKRYFFRYL
jgi:NitT/TauT family transport system permease protein